MNGSLTTGKCLFDPPVRPTASCPGRSPPLIWGHPGCAPRGHAKSPARLLCPPERRTEFEGWDTSYVHDTVDFLTPELGTTALGSLLAPVNKSPHGPGSRCEPATIRALRLSASITPL